MVRMLGIGRGDGSGDGSTDKAEPRKADEIIGPDGRVIDGGSAEKWPGPHSAGRNAGPVEHEDPFFAGHSAPVGSPRWRAEAYDPEYAERHYREDQGTGEGARPYEAPGSGPGDEEPEERFDPDYARREFYAGTGGNDPDPRVSGVAAQGGDGLEAAMASPGGGPTRRMRPQDRHRRRWGAGRTHPFIRRKQQSMHAWTSPWKGDGQGESVRERALRMGLELEDVRAAEMASQHVYDGCPQCVYVSRRSKAEREYAEPGEAGSADPGGAGEAEPEMAGVGPQGPAPDPRASRYQDTIYGPATGGRGETRMSQRQVDGFSLW